MIPLCFLAVFAAVGGLLAVALALGPLAAVASSALLAAPALGAVSLTSGLAAAIMAMRRYD
jgi:cation transporter-like permease